MITDIQTELEFRQYLIGLAQAKRYVRVHYYSDVHELLKVSSVVKSFSSQMTEDMLELASGEKIPYSQLIRVGDRLAPGHDAEDAYSCDC